MKEEYIVYCDESAKKGKYFGNFYGGAIVNAKQINELNAVLNKKKEELNLFGEIKWSKVTESYLNKYIEMMDFFFYYIKIGNIKIRIMFKPVCYIVNNLTDNQIDNEYYLLYYQFVKWAFGFENSNPEKNKELSIRFYFDKLPNSNRRGKKTIAKEKLYKHILGKIREIHPNFNIGVSTGLYDWNTWTIPYRHWKFIPSNSTYFSKLTKKQ